jgi:endo-1,4-beta-D-glucanase Y
MLLSVGNDDQAAFDQLWAYFKKNKNSAGMMKWQTTACGSAIADGSATDGDLDAAMALVQAGCAWGGTYEADAKTLIAAIASSAVATCGSGKVIKPGNNFGGCTETDPSYIAPAYYRVFQTLTGDAVWTDLLNSGYDLLEANQARKGGTFSDWSNDTGGTSGGSHSDDFGPDASRVPWRVATDYVWNDEPRAVPILDAFAAYVEAQGGVARAFTTNSNYRGGSAFSGIHKDAATAAAYTDAWLMTSVDDESYFPGTLRPVYMLLAANKFPKGCN